MKKIALAAACIVAAPLAVAGPFDSIKGRMKPGMYEDKIDMDMGAMPGLPPGMGKQSTTHQRCVTQKEIDEDPTSAKSNRKDEKCDIKDVKTSGDVTTYKMVCPKNNMVADGKISFTSSGYVFETAMTMDQGGQKMNMKQRIEGKYLGPCK